MSIIKDIKEWMDLFIHTQEGLQSLLKVFYSGVDFFFPPQVNGQLPAFKSAFSFIFPVNFPYMKNCK